MIRKIAVALSLAAPFSIATPTVAPAQTICYECVLSPWPPCMDCMWPVFIGHVSCIPYCNGTCSVGGPCQYGLRDLRLGSDGSVFVTMLSPSDALPPPPLSGRESEVGSFVRNCVGFVLSRFYPPSRALEMRAISQEIVI